MRVELKAAFFLFLFSLAVNSVMAKEKIRVACVGNSVTYGYGLPLRETQAYPVVLQQLLGERYDVRNFGHSGTTLLRHGHRPYVEQKVFHAALDFKPDEVVIHLGLNDTDPRNWPNYADDFVPDYIALIDSFRMANPHARIWLCLMTPIGHRHSRFESGTRDWHLAIQLAIRRVASTAGVGLIDLYTPLHLHPNLFPDALHPDAEGAALLAQVVYGYLSGDHGGLQIPEIYGSGMVIQRGRPISFKGMADAGEEVEVTINGRSRKVKAGADGQWVVEFPTMKAGGPYELDFKTSNRQFHFTDVWIGEVWLCSGQSNMEFPLSKLLTASEDEQLATDAVNLHYCNISTLYPTDDVEWSSEVLDSVNHLRLLRKPAWRRSSPESAKDFSAIAFHFGRVLADSLKVPIGIICNAVGGTTTESWIDRSTLETEFPRILHDWYHGDFGQPWARGRALKNISKSTNPLQRHPYEPCYMFEAGIQPLCGYPVKGIVWYQGESNAHNVELHERLFPLLEKSWRSAFQRPDLPFYVVQLSSLNRRSWPRFRDSQRRLANMLPHTWLATSYDLGDTLDVHFRNKRPLGERIARQALQHSYDYELQADCPEPSEIQTEGRQLYISFKVGGEYLVEGDSLLGFEIAGRDSIYHVAVGCLKDGKVSLCSPEVDVPIYVRYAWQPYTRANLVGAGGMPVSTFHGRSALVVEPLDGFPKSEKGIEKGVSACFAGVIDDCLLMAGGCNFPETPAAEGGKKRYYRGIYLAPLDGGGELKWKRVGSLPEATAYGVSVTTEDGVVCIGGNNGKTSLSLVYQIKMKNGKAIVENLPALPVALDNFTGALQGDSLVIFGDHMLYSLNLTNVQQGWRFRIDTSIQRLQPVSGFVGEDYCVWGGYKQKMEKTEASLSFDGLSFHNDKATRLDGPMHPHYHEMWSLCGAAAVNINNNDVVVMGGVDKDIFLNALNNPAQDYLTHPSEWYRFSPWIYSYESKGWSPIGQSSHVARAGAVLAMHKGVLYLIGGELKPGIRVPAVCRITL
ncbi:MAG: cyclically-permuted mutarotase family protein [Prevotella sp.]|nr:cyclically-permuted mutarotase family protein [Prevotella sp.]